MPDPGGRPLVNCSLADETGLHDGILTGMASTVKYAEFLGTVRFLFTTNSAVGAAVAPSTAFEAADVRVYKNGGTTESTAGVTMTSPFDSVTGLHQITIDLSADSSFYDLGSNFDVVLKPDDETVDGQTVVAIVGSFRVVLPGSAPGVPVAETVSLSADVITAGVIADGAIDGAAIDPSAAQKIAQYNVPPSSMRNLERSVEGGRRADTRRSSERNTERDGEGSAR
jgi:hypothetical protein